MYFLVHWIFVAKVCCYCDVICFCGAVAFHTRKFALLLHIVVVVAQYQVCYYYGVCMCIHTHRYSFALALITPLAVRTLSKLLCVCMCVCSLRIWLLATGRQTFSLRVLFLSLAKTNINKFRMPKRRESGNVCKSTLH